MLFRLVVEKNGKRGKAVELRAATARVGRSHGNEIRIPSAEVSRRHCQLRVEDGLLKVEDLESVNGTYLNGDLLTGEAVVRPGDRLDVGPVTFVVEYELTPEAVERLRELGREVEEDIPEVAVAAEEDEEVAEAEAVEDEEVFEAEEYTPRIDLEDVNWKPSGEGDLRDVLSHLDEGQESLLPRKRPGPRPLNPESDDWPDDRRSGLEEPPKPKNKGGKRRPKAEE